jgi:hypothetical protein
MLERRLHVRRSLVRGQFGEPKSKAGRRTISYGPRTADVLHEQFRASLYRSQESLVFCHRRPSPSRPRPPSCSLTRSPSRSSAVRLPSSPSGVRRARLALRPSLRPDAV